MTLARRIARVEAALTPEQAVLRWLAEAHAFPTLAHYVRSLIGGPESAWPLVAIPRQLEASVRAEHRRDTVAVLVDSMRTARREALARVEFVLRANLAAEEILATAALRVGLLEQIRAGAKKSAVHQGVLASIAALDLEAAARHEVERRILAGEDVLFPALAAEWVRLRERLVGLVDGRKAPAVPLAAVRARATDLAKLGDSATYALLGEQEKALVYPSERLRTGSSRSGNGRVTTPAPIGASLSPRPS